MSQPVTAPSPTPRKTRKARAGMAITALILGIIAICGSPIPILNNATIIAGFIGVIFGIIGLFGTRRVMAGIGTALAIGGIVIGLVLQAQWGKQLDQIGNDLTAAAPANISDLQAGVDAGKAIADIPSTPATPAPVTTQSPAASAAPAAPEIPNQVQSAMGKAQSYLSFKGFSRDGLIRQLSSQAGEGYPKDVATDAVDRLNVDWNQQAVKAAQSYLDFTQFSCSGLIQQLSSKAGEGFTKAQATYGAHQTSACK